jgi:hypothetical protein
MKTKSTKRNITPPPKKTGAANPKTRDIHFEFDGHTDFQRMTFTQKLEWLSEAVVSTYLLAKDNPGAGCGAFFKSDFNR